MVFHGVQAIVRWATRSCATASDPPALRSTEQQHAKRRERCLRSRRGTRICRSGSLNGLVARPRLFKLRGPLGVR